MSTVIEAMQELADDIVKGGVQRPVTIDSRNVSALPMVLVEPPTLTPVGTLCGAITATFPVYVIAPPGGLAELRALDALLTQVMEVVAEIAVWTVARPVGYVPLQSAGAADPCQSYRIDVERLIPWP